MQPDRLRAFKDLGDDGLLQRFVVIMLKDAALPKEYYNNEANRDWKNLVERLVQQTPLDRQLSPAAREEFRRINVLTHDLQKTYREMRPFQGFIGKLDGLWGAIALLLHVAWEGDVGNQVSVETARRASRIIEEFILPHAYIFYRSMAEDVQADDRNIGRAIVEHVNAGHKTITARDLQKVTGCCKRLPVEKVPGKLMGFTSGGWLTPVDDGPWCREWEINPAVVGFAVEATEQRRLHQEMVSKIKVEAAARKNIEEGV